MIATIKKYIFVPLLLFFTAVYAEGSQIQQADSAYSSGEYAKAVQLYQEVIERQGVSSALLYNLGNAYARSGDYGNAMVSYLRSLRLDPSNRKAKENIRYIESKVQESNQSELRGKKYSLDSEEEAFFTNARLFIARDHLANTWAIWAAIFFILFVACASTYIFTQNVIARKIGFFGGFILFGLSVIAIIFSFMSAGYRSDEGVIVTPKVKLMSEASISSKESPVYLTRGTKMKILDTYPADGTSPKWYKVRLNSDFVGWLQDTDFVPVDTYWGDGV